MKLCFFEVIAGDGGSTMGTLLKGTGKKQPLDAAEPEPIPNTSKVNEESIDSVIDSSTTGSEGSTSSKGQEKAIQNIQPTRVFDPMISNTDKNQLIYSRLQSAGNSSVEAVSETDDFSRWVDGCIGKIDINMDNLSLAQFEMPQTSNATIYTHDDSDETEIPSTSQEIINTPSTSKMLVSKEESSSKAKSPPTDESALLCEQNRSGTKITILRKTKIRTERVNLFKMEDAEKEHIKAIRRKRLEELVQKKKGNKKSIPLQNSFEVYVRAELDDELFNKSDKDDNGDE
ncbi:unnamed protein product [Ceutorhynchus assimilis]|uniref:Uncharacterized protein n=1 Tax=Ceutorhynchus assimilis TaxID=467358 RepID=A0A9P0GQ80_9CUCU|nr:unnamed protein product [Ceutorhynchus assimilis]